MIKDPYPKKLEKIKQHLRSILTSARYKHSLGVAKTAADLAEKYGVSKDKAVLAGLLHDAGKGFSRKGMKNYILRHGLKIDNRKDLFRYGVSLAHGDISAHIARTKFGITDRGILKAISSHTLGRPNMSRLSKIIYLADASAPDRRHPYVKTLRKKILRDLDGALLFSMGNKISYVIKKKQWVHPDAAKAWNSLITKRFTPLEIKK